MHINHIMWNRKSHQCKSCLCIPYMHAIHPHRFIVTKRLMCLLVHCSAYSLFWFTMGPQYTWFTKKQLAKKQLAKKQLAKKQLTTKTYMHTS